VRDFIFLGILTTIVKIRPLNLNKRKARGRENKEQKKAIKRKRRRNRSRIVANLWLAAFRSISLSLTGSIQKLEDVLKFITDITLAFIAASG
jgi:hypothetical protein